MNTTRTKSPFVLGAVVAAIFCSSVLFAAQGKTKSSPTSAPSHATKSADDFTEHFFDDDNINDYAAKIDTLIAKAEANVYASGEEMKQKGKIPDIKTASGIIMAYTIVANDKVGEMHYLSVSRPPYLATAFGCDIVGLFGDRAGFRFPPTSFRISENQVFHAVWIFPNQTLANDKKNAAELRAKKREIKSARDIMISAVLNAAALMKQKTPAQKEQP